MPASTRRFTPETPLRFLPVLRTFAITVGLLGVAAFAWAGEQPFEKAAYTAALAKGQPVIVDFSARGCPTCKAQKPIVQSLLKEPALQGVTLFVADFDTETALKRELRVTPQSTFVVFKAGQEVARSTGQTDKAVLAEAFAKAL